jgi:WD40 repeat protein
MSLRFVLVAAAVAALAGCGGSNDTGVPTTRSTATTTTAQSSSPVPKDQVLAATSDAAGSELFWVDGRTLEPVDDRGVEVSFFTSVGELSPDGDQLAVGESEGGSVLFVDLEKMRAVGKVDVDSASYVERLCWVKPDLVLASLGGTPGMVAAIDPETREILSVEDLGGATLYSQAAGKELVSLVAPTDRIGPARLVAFDGSELREVALADVPAGWEQIKETDDSDYRARQSVPGLAVDPEGRRALVVPAGNRVAEVDLDTMEVAYHDLSEPVSLWGRLRDWLEPSAHAKAMDGPDRNAVWLPNGLVAVSGAQYTMDGDKFDITPAGLVLIDPSDWSVHRLSDEPTWVTLRGGALLASAWTMGSNKQKLLVFDENGTPRFTLARDNADLSQTNGSHLYATTSNGTRFEIVDLETGETVGRGAPRRETWLLYLD